MSETPTEPDYRMPDYRENPPTHMTYTGPLPTPPPEAAGETANKTFPLSEAEYAMRAARYLFEKDDGHTRLVKCLDAGLEYLVKLERELTSAASKLAELTKELQKAHEIINRKN